MSSKSMRDHMIRDLLPCIASGVLGLFVASETYQKWGKGFLDTRKEEDQATIFLSSSADESSIKGKLPRGAAQAVFTDYIRRQFGPAALWNQHVIEDYLKMKITPSPIDKCKLDFCFQDLPFDGEIGLYRKLI